MKDRVIFRKWGKVNGGDVIACLPDNNANPGMMVMYEHIGQHGDGDYCGLLGRTTPAQPHEYASLLAELTSIGYDLQVMRRYSR